MPAQVTNYKCPTCTGPLHFVGASGKLECDYCGASYDVAQIDDGRALSIGLTDIDCVPGTAPDVILSSMTLQ